MVRILKISVLILALIMTTSSLLVLSSDQVFAGGSMVYGTVYTRNYMRDYRVTGWANVTATNGDIALRARTNTDGRYQLFLPQGSWELIVNVPGYQIFNKAIEVPDGGAVGYDFYLEESGVPIPEFQGYALPLIASMSLLIAIALLRRRSTTLSPHFN